MRISSEEKGGRAFEGPQREPVIALFLRSPAVIRLLKLVLTLFLFALLWEAACRAFQVPSYLLPAPSRIFAALFGPVSFLGDGLITLYETLLGFAAALVVGVLAASAVVVFPAIADIVMPLLLMAQLVPKVAIAPIMMIWLGYGLLPKIALAFLVSFFPIVINTASGLSSLEKELLDLAHSLEASRWQLFWKFRVPSALPLLFDGMKISITLAVIGAVISEFVGGSQGLGFLILMANQQLNTALAFASLLLMSLGGIVLYALVELAERILIPWNLSEERWVKAGGL